MALWSRKKTLDQQPPEVTPVPAVTPEEEQPQAEPAAEETRKKRRKQDLSKLTRNKVVQIRLTEEEVATLKGTASDAGMTLADFVMACCREKPIVTVTGVPELVLELRRQGTNLNQLARAANEQQDVRGLDLQAAAAGAGMASQTVVDFCLRWEAEIQSMNEKKVSQNGNNEGK